MPSRRTALFAAAILSIAVALGAYVLLAPPRDDGGHTIVHTASVFLMDQEERFAGTLAHGGDPASMLAKLHRLAGAGAGA